MKHKVSVIMTIYSRQYLAIRSVKSVMEQTYKNWELLIINVGANEEMKILRKIVKSDSRIKIYDIEYTGGLVAKDKGIEESSGEYITFLNFDDLFKPTKIEEELKYMIDNNCTFCHTAYDRVNYRGEYVDTVYENDNSILNSTVMIKKEMINNLKFIAEYKFYDKSCLLSKTMPSDSLGYLKKSLSETVLYN